jgi:hypothetical protein
MIVFESWVVSQDKDSYRNAWGEGVAGLGSSVSFSYYPINRRRKEESTSEARVTVACWWRRKGDWEESFANSRLFIKTNRRRK